MIKAMNETCIETIPIGNENVYMYLMGEEEIPLFNIFNFSRTQFIRSTDFFVEFYDFLCSLEIPERDGYYYFLIDVQPGQIVINTTLNPCPEGFYAYISYILANCKLNLTEIRQYQISILNPMRSFELDLEAGLHKDSTIFTCLTYVDSPVSTELVFDIEALNAAGVDWLECSPIFRFDTTGKFYTLCFNDNYFYHTIPIYEEEGKTIKKANNLSFKVTRSNGKFDLPDGDVREQIIPKYRTLVPKPDIRKVLICFLEDVKEMEDYVYGITIPVKLRRRNEEKIELTHDSINVIKNEEFLGRVRQKGGSRKLFKK